MNVTSPIQKSDQDNTDRHLYDGCPLCNSQNLQQKGVADCSGHALYDPRLSPKMRWLSCLDCDHVFTEGYFTDDACDIVFSRTHDNQKVGYQIEQNRLVSAQMIDRVLPFVSSGRWLDIGFGNGSLLFAAKEYGFHPIGVDLRKDNVEVMQNLGYEAYCEDFCTLDLSEPCHVISLMDVLEHVPYPKPFLKAVVDRLHDGGVCMLSMPNSEQILWDFMTMQNANPYWGEMEHYHNFSRTRLYALLEECGLKPLRYGVSQRYRACMEVIATKA